MTIGTKYNIGDEVYAMGNYGKGIIQCEVQDLEQELHATRKELEESKVVNGEKLHKASIEIQREKMYGKLQAKAQKEKRRAAQLTKEVVELRLELNRLKEEVI